MSARKSLLIRIDPRLHEELVAWAQQEFRSVNGQIEYLLRSDRSPAREIRAGRGR